jgi:hypothetical protein
LEAEILAEATAQARAISSQIAMRRKRTDPEKLRTSLDTPCPFCGYSIPPNELQRSDFTHVLCPSAGRNLHRRESVRLRVDISADKVFACSSFNLSGKVLNKELPPAQLLEEKSDILSNPRANQMP